MSTYEGPHVRPGEKIAIQVGDELVEDTVHTVIYRDARPEILKRPTGWRKLLRQLTPARWRKPLPIVRPAEPAHTEIVTVGNCARRAELLAERVQRTIDKMLR